MSILGIMSTYNEMNYLPLKIQWCKNNNIDLYVCDNLSTDDTWELLQKENIPSHQYDTQGMFSEALMQKEIYNTLVKLNPEWVLYMGCDLFFDIPEDYAEYDFVYFNYFSFKNTGETFEKFNPFSTYHYAMNHTPLRFLFKWNKDIVFFADDIIIKEGIPLDRKNIMINYGDTKPKHEREETRQRKIKSWQNGENSGWGYHYTIGNELDWIWDKNKLIDVSLTPYWPVIQKIEKDCGLT